MKRIAQDSWIITSVIILCAFAIGLWSYQKPAFTLEVNESVAKRSIKIVAEGDVLHYQETLFWDETKFSEILLDESEFFSHQIEKFMKTYEVNADNFGVEFVKDKNSTLLKSDVHGEFTGNRYDFHWFLNPLRLDFLDSPFDKSERALSWKGLIGGISTSIVLEFPFSISNCHAHVWPK
ncbi:MAG: hypothetical protein JRJ77_09540 [Deltaproteobacteria bacterium]|nr:hypothetical protein [Deltaproteobacteria bacterium]MBW2339797.1 hypothetical protein [Deltaproteobacteria bacterium]